MTFGGKRPTSYTVSVGRKDTGPFTMSRTGPKGEIAFTGKTKAWLAGILWGSNTQTVSMPVDWGTNPRSSAGSGAASARSQCWSLLRCFVVSLVASGCGAAVGPPDPPQDPCAAAHAIRSGPQFLSVAEEADIAARVIPGGFGGSIVVERTRGGRTNWSPRTSWALQPVRGDPGGWAVEVDPELNRIWIGLGNSSELPRIRQMVSDRAVPLAAVVLETPAPSTGGEPFAVLEQLIAHGGPNPRGLRAQLPCPLYEPVP